MSCPITIVPIPSEDIGEDKKFKKLPHHEILFKPPFTCAVLGAIGSGKSSFAYSMMDKHYKNYFDEIVVFCGTMDSKESWEKVHQKNVLFLNAFDDEAFNEYLDSLEKDQEERKKEGKFPFRCAIIMDDIVFQGFSNKRQGTIERLFMTCRHFNISVIIALQHSKQISPSMRNQIFYYVLFRLTQNDLEKVAKEHGNQLSEEEFIDLHTEIMKKGKHEFMIIDYKAPFHERFRHRFNTIISLEE